MMTDMHAHVLPGVDDGSASLEESLGLLGLLARQGIRRVVATPHFYAHHDRPEAFLARRAEAARWLGEALADHPELPAVELGAEVYFFQGMSDSDLLQRLTIGEKRCILIEMPLSPWTDRMYRELADIREKQDLVPIVAHVDRYIGPFRTHGIPRRLEQLPVLVQANAGFFLNRSTAAMALGMVRREQIHLLGSDCHDLTARPPRLGQAAAAIRQRLGDAPLERIRENERFVLDLS